MPEMKPMTPKHKLIYESLLDCGYEVDEILPDMGKTILRKNINSTQDHTQWQYVTILKDGSIRYAR